VSLLVHANRAYRQGCYLRREELGGEFVFVQESAESVAPADASPGRRRTDRDRFGDRWLLCECAVWPVGVVVVGVFAQDVFEVSGGEDQDAVEALASGTANPALGANPSPASSPWMRL
jgi:hypothetical protein